MDCGKEKLFWIDVQSSFIFGTQVRKVILLRFRLQNGRRLISNTLKIGRIIFSVLVNNLCFYKGLTMRFLSL